MVYNFISMKLTCFIFILFLFSCSSSKKVIQDYSYLGEPTNQDYIEHLSSLGSDYLSSKENSEIKLKSESLLYLDQIYERIVSNNEQLLRNQFKPRFHFINSAIPYIFSLPQSQFFISKALVEKYLKSEELFITAIATEILKSNRNIYEKKIMIPLGFYSSEKMIQLTRLKQETKYQLNEWTYFILKRSALDPTAYLNWIQIQNRNMLDFSIYLGDSIGISKEEHYFKNFMTRQGVAGLEKITNEANSSKSFYKLLNNITSNK